MKLRLYHIQDGYASFLYEADNEVMKSFGDKRTRPYIGPFYMDSLSYYIPFSTKEHDSEKIEAIHEGVTFMKVIRDGVAFAGLKINKAIPVPDDYLIPVDTTHRETKGDADASKINDFRYEYQWAANRFDSILKNFKTFFRLYREDALKPEIKKCTCDKDLLKSKQKEYLSLFPYYSESLFKKNVSMGTDRCSFYLDSQNDRVSLRDAVIAINALRKEYETSGEILDGDAWAKIAFANGGCNHGFIMFDASNMPGSAAATIFREITRALNTRGFMVDGDKNLLSADSGNIVDNHDLSFQWVDGIPAQQKNGTWDARIRATDSSTDFQFVIGEKRVSEKAAIAIANLDRFGSSQLPPLPYLEPGRTPAELPPRSKSRTFHTSDLRKHVVKDELKTPVFIVLGATGPQLTAALNASLYRDSIDVFNLEQEGDAICFSATGVTAWFVNEVCEQLRTLGCDQVRGFGVKCLDFAFSDGTKAPDETLYSLRLQNASLQADGTWAVTMAVLDKQTGFGFNYAYADVPESVYRKCLRQSQESILRDRNDGGIGDDPNGPKI
jgi:hypothetical protein